MIASDRPAHGRHQVHKNSDSQVLLCIMEHQNDPHVETRDDGCVASSMTINVCIPHNREVTPVVMLSSVELDNPCVERQMPLEYL